jgi:SAM-dependent methyltransferase
VPGTGRGPAGPVRCRAQVAVTLGHVELRDAWEKHAADWVRWAREPGHDSYWSFHRDRFLELVSRPGRLTIDLGCGEGRLARDLTALGHSVVAVDSSLSMVKAARAADPELEVVVADAASLPFADGAADLVVAFMSLHDIDDMSGAVREAARVLEPGGHLVAAVVHPINAGGKFESRDPDAAFVIRESYFDRRRYTDAIERDGLRMTFESRHWTLEDYVTAMADSGLMVDAVREITEPDDARWSRLPLFLHFRAVRGKASQPG